MVVVCLGQRLWLIVAFTFLLDASSHKSSVNARVVIGAFASVTSTIPLASQASPGKGSSSSSIGMTTTNGNYNNNDDDGNDEDAAAAAGTSSEFPLLPPPSNDSNNDKSIPSIRLGETIRFEEWGPIILNLDGTARRISNWDQLTEQEQKVTWRRISKRNEERRLVLLKKQEEEQQQQTAGNSDEFDASKQQSQQKDL